MFKLLQKSAPDTKVKQQKTNARRATQILQTAQQTKRARLLFHLPIDESVCDTGDLANQIAYHMNTNKTNKTANKTVNKTQLSYWF